MVTDQPDLLKPSAEDRYAAELERLAADDTAPRPQGWRLSPQAVRRFIIGDEKNEIPRKFYGDDGLVDRCVVTLMGNQGLMLVGEPGTAKTMLSELLTAAISGDTSLTVQGSAGITEDQIRYSWNYALLLAEGPTERALVPSPVYKAMTTGRLVRFEEITRCPPEVQDVLISLLSDKQIQIAEWDRSTVHAQRGFNIIATANLRDRGVHEMSSALKRRFNFETVYPIADREFEIRLVTEQVARELAATQTQVALEHDMIELLVTTFQDLRSGHSAEGGSVRKPEAVMSTAEAVNVAHAAALQACYLGNGKLGPAELAAQLQGVVTKDNEDDRRRVRHYFDTVVKERARRSSQWKAFYKAARATWRD